MAQQHQKRNDSVGFKHVQLLKDQTLGIGSYGKVCKAKCDDLLCAAKLIHETLFDPTAHQLIAPQREHRLPMRRFEQECEFLSTIRHPNIIQYLGLYRDPDTGLPALLMELMDDSLTHFLESSTQPIPYHIQVNICLDITLALSFLHSNSIAHRDLSSNNVLIVSNALRAKVTDFGMASLGDQTQRATHLTFTMCPGTDVYMPPEAVQDEPVYTEKIDCFSFGVITLQILTRQFPNPGDRWKEIEINPQPGIPAGTVANIPVPEMERRQNHISIIDPNHTLLHVSLDCLKDKNIERPSAQQLCGRLAALKESPEYSESVRDAEDRNTAEQGRGDEKDREIRSLRQQHTQQVQSLKQLIQSQVSRLEEKDQALREKDETIAAGQQNMRQQLNKIKEREKELGQQLKESKEEIARFRRQITELEQLRPATDATPTSKQQSSSSRARIKMTWREGENAPCGMSSPHNAVADGNALYVRERKKVYSFTTSTSSWSQLPNTPTYICPSVVVNNLLTLVGGDHNRTITNKLFSLTGEGSDRKWTEEFPPMPTKRQGSTALCTGTALIVAGGESEDRSTLDLRTVEVMNTETLQWYTAADLPQPMYRAPGAVCGDYVYILSLTGSSKSMYMCPVNDLILSCWSRPTADVWNKVAAPPVTQTACVSILGRLLTIGGVDSNNKPTTAVYMYNPDSDSWKVISHMATPRRLCFAAVLPNDQLMVVGGYTNSFESSEISPDSVELATVE